jgi:hypothetical protein
MKQIFLFFAILISGYLFSQADSLPPKPANFDSDTLKLQIKVLSKGYFLAKEKKQLKTANAMLAVGSTLIVGSMVVGGIIYKDDWLTGAIIFILGTFIGTVLDLTSVPFYISAKHNSNKAKPLP